MALWDQDHPDLESIKIRVYPPVLAPATTRQVAELRQAYAHAQLAPLLGEGLQFGLPGGLSPVFKTVPNPNPNSQLGATIQVPVTRTVYVTKPVPPQPAFGPGVSFDHFLAYDYHEDFLTPSDSWSFSLDTDELTEIDLAALVPGARVEVSIDGNVQSIGYIRKTRIRSTKESGSVMHVEGRDWLSPSVDSHVSPDTVFNGSMNFEQVLQAVFTPFGFQVQFTQDDTGNLNSITGRKYGVPVTKKGKPLKSYIVHELKPYPQEGAFAFASRVAQRFGLWLWPMVDGKTIMVGQPNFTAPARYAIHHKLDATSNGNNVIEGDVAQSDEEQPAIIFASGFGGGGEFAHATLRGVIINPLISVPVQLLANLLAPYPGLIPTVPTVTAQSANQSLITNDSVRPLYLYDPESHTQEQLEAFLRRELSLRMRKALTVRYVVMGHKINAQPLAVNTTMDVDDDRGRLHMPMWIMGRHFSKTADAGTRTELELIRPGTLVF